MERDPLAERIEAAQRRAAARAQPVRARLPAAAAALRARGATRTVLFGSLATRDRLHEASDVDLAVWGLPRAEYFAAAAELVELLGADVDLVEMESCPPSIAARVETDGEEILDGAE